MCTQILEKFTELTIELILIRKYLEKLDESSTLSFIIQKI